MFLFRHRTDRLTPQQARARTGDAAAVLLDVREVPEWKAGHAPGAVHLPLTRLLAGTVLPAAVQGRPVVAICRSGHRSQQAAKILTSRGIDAVDVAGGMNAWAKAGLPVVDERGQDGRIA
ncbi:rhodanese-like domain-containing protein [Streptomyces sp. H27-S2]|uniref:rhodanese-like domain-containing protein n=1 Tax=Streptomyces antarcticus TaxID=2996458 RepID=UPI00226EF2E6|nr:rhodanese-like domain-containing protein [Streptomyces sp. H27-S2]MCY0949854.1 rhodanese-like domain-containing protein [Streptomyces sp. H27-S2]